MADHSFSALFGVPSSFLWSSLTPLGIPTGTVILPCHSSSGEAGSWRNEKERTPSCERMPWSPSSCTESSRDLSVAWHQHSPPASVPYSSLAYLHFQNVPCTFCPLCIYSISQVQCIPPSISPRGNPTRSNANATSSRNLFLIDPILESLWIKGRN